jgi:transforming growth factor-beta-induced protein
MATATAVVAPTAQAATKAPAKATKDIVDTAVGAGDFGTLATALQAAGLVDTLKGKGPFTVFAPTDAAFRKLPAATLSALLLPENKAALQSVLTYHVVAGKVLAKDVVKLNGKSVKTVSGSSLKVTVSGSQVKVNESNVIATDVLAKNGVIHVLDAVLVPADLKLSIPAPAPTTTAAPALKNIVDTAIGAGSFKTLAAALTAAGLVDTLKGPGPFTVFAPTDAAFAKLPAGTIDSLLKPENKATLTGILTYHVVAGKVAAADVVKLTSAKTVNGADVKIKVDGSKVFVNDAQVTTTDVQASNGIIHVIDSVLLPPASTPKVANNIIDVAAQNGSFTTLLAAVDAAGLTSTLQGPGPFTVFAPTDTAFKLLGPDTIAALLKPENKAQLTSVLTLHVVGGAAVRAAAIPSLSDHKAKSLNGKDLKFVLTNGKVFVNGGQVIIADVPAGNGVIHVIDTVLLP